MRRSKRLEEKERRFFLQQKHLREKRKRLNSSAEPFRPDMPPTTGKAAGNLVESKVAAAKVSRVGVSHG
jgi:hypothetical protein